MFYRFNCGTFVDAESFEEAKQKLIAEIVGEVENPKEWCPCTCLGLSHSHNCPEMEGVIPF